MLYKVDGSKNQYKYKLVSTGKCSIGSNNFNDYALQNNSEFMDPLIIKKREISINE